MEALIQCKTQICIFIILLFLSYLFVKDGNRLNNKTHSRQCNHIFDWLFVLGELAVIFDGLTCYTVNHLDQVSEPFNMMAHLFYMLVYEAFIFVHFLYWLSVTDSLPKTWIMRVIAYGPIMVSAILTAGYIPQITYTIGEYTNYSEGTSAYACFSAIGIYSFLTLFVFIINKNYILKNRRTAFIVALSGVCTILLIQMIFKETLVASIAVALVIFSIYFCMENPTIKFLNFYHDEMIMGFATLVESKDGSTGGHIKRSSTYAVLIAKELQNNPKYKKYITGDYINELNKAAPMHDIGKIGIPDSILQKPGKLTDGEFETMKAHTEIGGRIIKETFGHLDDEEYENMTYKLAMGHHEKWNGKGYPQRLAGMEIPLAARIMAVADVFDAVSADRCYRAALPLEECFQIIMEGRGTDFDPDVVDAFFACQKEVEEVYHSE